MNIAPVQENEQERIKTPNGYFIPDALPEAQFNDILYIAAETCNTPIALISIIDADKELFRATHGISVSQIPPDNSFCLNTPTITGEVVIIPDLTKDTRYRTDTLVTGAVKAVFYAGLQLTGPDGQVLGTLCVLDTKNRDLNAKQVKILKSLARQAVAMLELSIKTAQLQQKEAELTSSYADFEKIAHIASHDLKSPLNNIISLTHLLKDEHSKKLDEEGNEYITFLNEASYQLSDLVSGIVSYMRASQLPVDNKEEISVTQLIEEVAGSLNTAKNASVKYKKSRGTIYASRVVIKQILSQLMHNAVQYNDTGEVKIEVAFHENKHSYTFEVKDNGPGIADADKEKVFTLFERLHKKTKDGENMGIGLTIVKRLVEKTGGELKLESEVSKGSSFVFTIPK